MPYTVHDGEGGTVTASTMLEALVHHFDLEDQGNGQFVLTDGDCRQAVMTRDQVAALGNELLALAAMGHKNEEPQQ